VEKKKIILMVVSSLNRVNQGDEPPLANGLDPIYVWFTHERNRLTSCNIWMLDNG
jgi:hypothetical protein